MDGLAASLTTKARRGISALIPLSPGKRLGLLQRLFAGEDIRPQASGQHVIEIEEPRADVSPLWLRRTSLALRLLLRIGEPTFNRLWIAGRGSLQEAGLALCNVVCAPLLSHTP
jgi:hypothetical protein